MLYFAFSPGVSCLWHIYRLTVQILGGNELGPLPRAIHRNKIKDLKFLPSIEATDLKIGSVQTAIKNGLQTLDLIRESKAANIKSCTVDGHLDRRTLNVQGSCLRALHRGVISTQNPCNTEGGGPPSTDGDEMT